MAKKPLQHSLCLLGLATIAVLFGWPQLSRQRAEKQALESRIQKLDTELRTQRRALAALGRDNMLAESQLEQMRTPAPQLATLTDPAREAEVAHWRARHDRLRQRFIGNPVQSIPQLRLLTDAQWLSLAKWNTFGSEPEIRRAMAHARTLAMRQLFDALQGSVRALARAENQPAPTSIAALIPHLEDPALVDLLADLQLEPAAPGAPSSSWRIQSRVPLDPEHEPLYFMNSAGVISTSLPPAR